MQVLVLYYSKGGKTKELAEAVAQGVHEVEGINCTLRAAETVTVQDFLESHGIIAGSPVYFGSMAAELKKVFDQFIGIRSRMENRIGAAFATCNHPNGGKETTIISIIQAMLIYGMIVVGDPLEASGHYGVACSGPINDVATNDARKLGNRVAKLVKKQFGE